MLLAHYPKLWYELLALVLDLPPTPISTARIGRPTVAQYSTSEPSSFARLRQADNEMKLANGKK